MIKQFDRGHARKEARRVEASSCASTAHRIAGTVPTTSAEVEARSTDDGERGDAARPAAAAANGGDARAAVGSSGRTAHRSHRTRLLLHPQACQVLRNRLRRTVLKYERRRESEARCGLQRANKVCRAERVEAGGHKRVERLDLSAAETPHMREDHRQ